MGDPSQGSVSSVGSSFHPTLPSVYTLPLALVSLAENSHSHPLSPPLGCGSSFPSLSLFPSRLWAGRAPGALEEMLL